MQLIKVIRPLALACVIILAITLVLAVWEGRRGGAELDVDDVFELLVVLAGVRFIAAALALSLASLLLRERLRLYASATATALVVSTIAFATDSWWSPVFPWMAALLIEGLIAAAVGTAAGVRWRMVVGHFTSEHT